MVVVSQRQLCASISNTAQLMLYREVITVCFQILTKHVNTVCGQNTAPVMLHLAVGIAIPGGGRKDITLFESSQTLPARPSGRRSMKTEMKLYKQNALEY
jgi:hypothetical protein